MLDTNPVDHHLFVHTIPWKLSPFNSRDYFAKVRAGSLNAEPFIIFKPLFDEHEIAHLLCCEDKDLLDPFWGMGVPLEEEVFPVEETKVIFITYLMRQLTYVAPVHHRRDFEWAISPTIHYNPCDVSDEEIKEECFKMIKKFPTVDSLVQEYNRKAKLIDQLLKEGQQT